MAKVLLWPRSCYEVKAAVETGDTDKIVSCYGDPFVFEDIAARQRITDREQLRDYVQRLFAVPGARFTDFVILPGEEWAAVEWTWTRPKEGTNDLSSAARSLVPYQLDASYHSPLPDGERTRVRGAVFGSNHHRLRRRQHCRRQ